ASLCLKVISRTRSPTLTASSTSAESRRGVETATSTPHDSLNSHSFLGSLMRATTLGTPYSVLASSETTRLTLSSGGGDDHVAPLQRGLVQRGDLTRVREEPLGPGHGVNRDRPGVLVDEQDLVPVIQQLTGDRAADRAGARNRDPHQPDPFPCDVSPGLLRANAAEMRSRSLSAAITYSTSPSWSTVPGASSMASPSLEMYATRVRAASSSACTFSPTHFSE